MWIRSLQENNLQIVKCKSMRYFLALLYSILCWHCIVLRLPVYRADLFAPMATLGRVTRVIEMETAWLFWIIASASIVVVLPNCETCVNLNFVDYLVSSRHRVCFTMDMDVMIYLRCTFLTGRTYLLTWKLYNIIVN